MTVDDPSNGAVVFAASNRRVLMHRLSALHLFFLGWLVSIPVIYFQPTLPPDRAWAGILLSLFVGSLSLFIIVMGFGTLFGRLPRLLLDPATRQAHLDWEWPRIWPRETIAFDDFIAAGVRCHSDLEGRIVLLFIRLAPDREITLWYFSDSFRGARDIAERICQLTGAELGM